MNLSAVQFGAFRLDPADRRLSRGGETIELNARYMDVLILLIRADGELVAKNRFMDEVWSGVPVTDEALTQAIRTLRRTLGDAVRSPQFIETVPKHGYRFIAKVKPVSDEPAEARGHDPVAEQVHSAVAETRASTASRGTFIGITLAGTGGAVLAGLLVGLLYGFAETAQSPASGGGAISLLLVLALVAMLSSSVAGVGIVAGFAASMWVTPARWYWAMIGGALGGLIVGAFANLIGKDVFRLLFGQDVREFAGALEGLILGSAVGLAAFVSRRQVGHAIGIAALLGAGAGLIIAMLGGRMLAGSLQELVATFPASPMRFGGLNSLFVEGGFGPIGRAVTAAFEGAVFSAAVTWALILHKRLSEGGRDNSPGAKHGIVPE